MIPFKKALVLIAHPDDELMCAGTIMKLQAAGCEVFVIVSSRPQHKEHDRHAEFEMSMNVLGVPRDNFCLLVDAESDFQWNGFWVKGYDNLVLGSIRPDLIITHRVRDSQQHHSHLANIAHSLARKNNVTVWELEQAMPGGIEPDAPAPNFFVDVSRYWYVKKQIIEAYPSQSVKYPGWLEALKARATMWGWMTNMNGDQETIGTTVSWPRYVEAFRVQKQFWLD